MTLNYIQTNKDAIFNEWVQRLKEQSDETVSNVILDQNFTIYSNELIELAILKISGSVDVYETRLEDFSDRVVRLGWPLRFVVNALDVLSDVIYECMVSDDYISRENQAEVMHDLNHWIKAMISEIINDYTTSWERTVSNQKIALQELSAPLIPIFEGITVMPLVGTIDTDRARQIMENLLQGAVKHRSEVVLIDITGVPVVDTMVAHHIIQAADAVHLIGAKCMLVGIRAEIAQTIVSLGIDLNRVITKNTLKAGVEAALEMTKRKIVPLEGQN
ncbi:rsbT co-antagonist protein RsbR [Cytobacillus horneckiae]|uniref:STAS domain-containing protein n=1 Tax=Cytobacillus horneckiae TaxID=549687 RepID=A0A2N0ZJQ2_9BACI|nr:STAS domain-containing protein [Cytobacillus horneckiae]NRG46936.1 STAS domain-containing protein [Bacillus sp. CRN 9]MBN6888580.1 STAS domain-containing protein [Cytobacillus horneckiae]MEC1158860.1 STAS domain-containing protein [Cytobacillus horneckiae]MED2938719.1 STAS domain-containing protein [Cytobacillus horneckiae]PKG29760.1 STAS domain-containing protein [Cytobacillus horneckiae]